MATSQFKIRRAFEQTIGPTKMAYILHLRPLEWPVITVHFLVGSLLATGLEIRCHTTILGWLVFVLLLNGGTMAINSVFDQDDGDIGYLRQPPSPPKYLLHISTGMLVASFVIGFRLPTLFAWCNAICVVMSVLYSVPPFRLKSRAGWDLFVNCLGFGLLTPLAGWGLTGRPVSINIISIVIGFAFLFGALYPLTQLYQIEEDRNRKDRTLTIVLGEPTSIMLSISLTIIAHLWFTWGALCCGRNLSPIIVSLMSWLMVLLPWRAKWRQWTPKQHESGMYKALAVWAITDINILVTFWRLQC